MAQEFSENQRATSNPDKPKSKPKEKDLDYEVPPAIDKRVKEPDGLLDFVMGTVQKSVDARGGWQTGLKKHYEQYRGVVAEKDFPWEGCSNLHIPLTATIVDTLLSRFLNPIFSVTPFVIATGASVQGSQDQTVQPNGVDASQGGQPNQPRPNDSDKARDVESMMHYVLSKRINVYPKIRDWIKESLIYGRGVIKVVWKKEMRKYTRQMSKLDVQADIQTAQGMIREGSPTKETIKFMEEMLYLVENHDFDKKPFIGVEREELVYNLPDWVFIPIEDFGFHPRAIDIATSPYVYHRFMRDTDELLKLQDQGVYDNVEKLGEPAGRHVGSGSTGGEDLLDDVQTLEEGYEDAGLSSDENLGEHRIIEWHGKYDVDGDGRMEDMIVTYSPDSRVLLSARETDLLHGKKPFSEIKLFPMPGRFESQGVPEMVADLQVELNDIHNQRVDNGSLTNATMFYYDPTSDIDPEVHRPGPGMGFPAAQNQFGIVQTGDVKYSSFREEEGVRRLVQDRIGVTDFAIGNDSSAITNKTATGINSIVQEGNQRLEMMLQNVSIGINEAILQTLQLLQQFGDDEILYRVVEDANGSMRKISAREIVGQWDIEISANSVNTNRLLQLQDLQQQLQVAMQAGPANINVAPLLSEWFRKIGSKLVKDIVVPEEEAFMRKISADPQQILALKQKIDQMVMQFAPEMVQPPAQVDPATGQPMAPQPPGQPQAQGQPQQQQDLGGGLEGLMSQPLGAIVQQLVGKLGL
tara:strand:- start:8891 stop:11140 length:2250 start_codon:yes stop_codon:yes gene_type:complete